MPLPSVPDAEFTSPLTPYLCDTLSRGALEGQMQSGITETAPTGLILTVNYMLQLALHHRQLELTIGQLTVIYSSRYITVRRLRRTRRQYPQQGNEGSVNMGDLESEQSDWGRK